MTLMRRPIWCIRPRRRQRRGMARSALRCAGRWSRVIRGQARRQRRPRSIAILATWPPAWTATRRASTFTPDPSLAFLTSTGGSAPRLITDRAAPQRGSTPPVTRAGEWSDDGVLQLESALEVALHLFDEAGIVRFNAGHLKRLAPMGASWAS